MDAAIAELVPLFKLVVVVLLIVFVVRAIART